MRISTWLVILLLGLPGLARAEEHILLAEILPALVGTELGAIELGAAPPPGTSRLVHRGEVLAALRLAHRTTAGLAIPNAVRVERRAHVLDAAALTALARPAVESAVGACTVAAIRPPARIIVPVGRIDAQAEIEERLDSGPTAAVLLLTVGGRSTRVPLQLSLLCPPPIVEPGQRVRLIVRIGSVRATTLGEARQAGRIGELIRVTNVESGAALRGRIVASDAVEVVQ